MAGKGWFLENEATINVLRQIPACAGMTVNPKVDNGIILCNYKFLAVLKAGQRRRDNETSWMGIDFLQFNYSQLAEKEVKFCTIAIRT